MDECILLICLQIVRPVSMLLVVDVQNDFISGTLNISHCSARQNGAEVRLKVKRLRVLKNTLVPGWASSQHYTAVPAILWYQDVLHSTILLYWQRFGTRMCFTALYCCTGNTLVPGCASQHYTSVLATLWYRDVLFHSNTLLYQQHFGTRMCFFTALYCCTGNTLVPGCASQHYTAVPATL